MGTIYAYDQKQYVRWSASVNRPNPKIGLAQLLNDVGGQVERGGFEFRN